MSTRLKTVVITEVSVAALALVAGRVFSSAPLWWLSTVILWVAYLRHAWRLWNSDHDTYPHFLNLWPWLFQRVRGTKEPRVRPFFPDVAFEAAFGPVLASSVWFLWQWIGWTCGGDTDRYSEIPVSQPWWPSILQLCVIGYYWWTVFKRFKAFGTPDPMRAGTR